jgi:hypothetical protein
MRENFELAQAVIGVVSREVGRGRVVGRKKVALWVAEQGPLVTLSGLPGFYSGITKHVKYDRFGRIRSTSDPILFENI